MNFLSFTDHDVDTVFAPELAGLDRAEIRRWYNGYNWLGEAVYNPFDLLLLFRNRRFRPYWFETGTPTFLVKLLTQRGFFTPNLARLQAGERLLSTFDVDAIANEALLFQTGYLTLHDAQQPLLGHWVYTLGRDKNYAEKYRGNGPVHLVGVEFSKDSRNIVGFDTETLL